MNYIAQVNFEELVGEATPGLSGQTPADIVSTVVTLVFPIAGFVLLGMLIYSGYQYMTSAGDPKLTAKAQQGITYSIIGFIIMFAAFFVVDYFGYALQIEQIQEIFGGGTTGGRPGRPR